MLCHKFDWKRPSGNGEGENVTGQLRWAKNDLILLIGNCKHKLSTTHWKNNVLHAHFALLCKQNINTFTYLVIFIYWRQTISFKACIWVLYLCNIILWSLYSPRVLSCIEVVALAMLVVVSTKFRSKTKHWHKSSIFVKFKIFFKTFVRKIRINFRVIKSFLKKLLLMLLCQWNLICYKRQLW